MKCPSITLTLDRICSNLFLRHISSHDALFNHSFEGTFQIRLTIKIIDTSISYEPADADPHEIEPIYSWRRVRIQMRNKIHEGHFQDQTVGRIQRVAILSTTTIRSTMGPAPYYYPKIRLLDRIYISIL